MAGIVIVGTGQAGAQAAASLRQLKYDGEITMIGDDPHIPYQRPLLSKQYLSGEEGGDRLYLRAEAFYEGKNITLKTGERIESIDTRAQTVTSENGESTPYSKLLLATGSRPRILSVPGCQLAGIHYLRTLDDVDAIKSAMQPGKKMVVVGGGYVGLEVASVAVTLDLDVTVIETADRILQRVTTPEMSDYYHNLHVSRGVKILTHTEVSGFGGDTHVSSVLCGDQKVEADIVIVGIGIVPNVELAEAAGLQCGNGILVDDRCRTTVDNVYAAGDCTNHPNPILNRRLRLESVPNAMEQARVVAANMMGGDKVYSAVPWFWSDQYELKLQMVGFSADGDTQVVRGDMSANQFAVFYLKDGVLVAVDAVNSPREFTVAKQLYERKLDPTCLADPEFDLKDLLKR